MGPKSFLACYICLKEFGSRSLTFHEPKCLERWRSSNRSLPIEKRTPTPVKPVNRSQDNNCPCRKTGVPVSSRKGEDESVCFDKKLKSSNASPKQKHLMTGVEKTDLSPKKGKENKNSSNHIPTPNVGKKNAKNDAKTESPLEPLHKDYGSKNKSIARQSTNIIDIDGCKVNDDVCSTSKRSIRPQTKILRRPTPNLKHPVIQVDSDDSSGGDSSCSDKSKEDNPKRLKMGSGDSSADSTHKPKNFIMYNKYNVDKNTKNAVKERTSATVMASIPNPCNSCNRSLAPERLHSHARKDARGLMFRRSPSLDVKMTSPQKKFPEGTDRIKLVNKETKNTQQVIEKTSSQTMSAEVVALNKEKEDLVDEGGISIEDAPSPDEELVELEKACYICQKEFKVSALLLHESKCLENWKKVNNSLRPNLRKLPPRRPEEGEDQLPDSEDDPAWTTVQSQLVPCPVCGRTFFPERMPVHRRVCKGKPSPTPLKRASSLREQSASPRDEEDLTPDAVYMPCYVCGRSYGSWVISMHEQHCLKKWRGENEKLPCSEQQEEPKKFQKLSSDDVASLVELGDNAWESHLQQLVPCPLCSRTFFPDRLRVHKRSCKGPSCSRRPRSNKGT